MLVAWISRWTGTGKTKNASEWSLMSKYVTACDIQLTVYFAGKTNYRQERCNDCHSQGCFITNLIVQVIILFKKRSRMTVVLRGQKTTFLHEG